MIIKKDYLPIGKVIKFEIVKDGKQVTGTLTRRPGRKIPVVFIIVHNNGNSASTLNNEVDWLTNQRNAISASWNIMIKGTEAVEVIPWGEASYNAGNYTANMKSYGVEIHDGGDRDVSNRSAINFIADKIYYTMGKGVDDVVDIVKPHKAFTNTSCPANLYAKWGWFLGEIKARIGYLSQGSPMEYKSPIVSGDTGEYVKFVQRVLGRDGYNLAVDGSFGPNTKQAVMKFQVRYKLVADGSVGPATFKQIQSVFIRPYTITYVSEQTRYIKIPMREVADIGTDICNHDHADIRVRVGEKCTVVKQGEYIGTAEYVKDGMVMKGNTLKGIPIRGKLLGDAIGFSPSLFVGNGSKKIELAGHTFLYAKQATGRLAVIKTTDYLFIFISEFKDNLRGFTGISTYLLAEIIGGIVPKEDVLSTEFYGGEVGGDSCLCEGREMFAKKPSMTGLYRGITINFKE